MRKIRQEVGRLQTEREKEVLPLEGGCQSSADDTGKTICSMGKS